MQVIRSAGAALPTVLAGIAGAADRMANRSPSTDGVVRMSHRPELVHLVAGAMFVACVGMAAAAGASAALPADAAVPVLRSVSTAGLDLTSAAGRDGLRHRIRSAARLLCRSVSGVWRDGGAGFLACTRHAAADGWAEAQETIAEAEEPALAAAR